MDSKSFEEVLIVAWCTDLDSTILAGEANQRNENPMCFSDVCQELGKSITIQGVMNECLEKKFRNQVADYSKEDWADCRSSREKKSVPMHHDTQPCVSPSKRLCLRIHGPQKTDIFGDFVANKKRQFSQWLWQFITS